MVDTIQPRGTTRQPWIATFLSLLVTGMGYVYCGRIVKGFLYFLIANMLFIVALVATVLVYPAHVNLGLVFTLAGTAVWLYTVHDSSRTARRIEPDYVLKDYNRWYFYVIILLVCIQAGVGLGVLVRSTAYQAFRISSNSMHPNLQLGDRVLSNKLAYGSDPVRRGDIVTFLNPNEPRVTYVKRIIALPGDTIEIKNYQVYLNGRKLDCRNIRDGHSRTSPNNAQDQWCVETNEDIEYVVLSPQAVQGSPSAIANASKVTVPPGHVFVLGDKRDESTDSRSFGPIPLGSITGRVDCVYFPAGDWSRFGKVK